MLVWFLGVASCSRVRQVSATLSACLPVLARFRVGRARLRGLQLRLKQRSLRKRIEAALASSGG